MTRNRLVALVGVIALLGAARADAQLLLQSVTSSTPGFGWSAASAGDVDKDGFGDLIVGNYLSQSAQVFSGQTGEELLAFGSVNPNVIFGYSVSGVGDVNGDGHDDVIVGAVALCCVGTAGAAFVYSGKDGTILYSYTGGVDEGYGFCVAGVGDMNQDGRPDFAVSAYSNSTNGTYAGKVVVYSGKTGAVLHTFLGDGPQDFFGHWMSGAGDINQDGNDDFLFLAVDRVEVRSGKTGALLLTLTEYGIGAANSLAGTGDVNDDGYPDIIVGNTLRDDGVSGGGHATVFSGEDGSVLFEFAGTTVGESIGQAVAGGGDVNGDGVSDFILTRFGTGSLEAYAGVPVPPASWENYDQGWPGTNGVPSLTASAPPILCSSITIDVGNSRGAATTGFLVEGLAPAHVPTPFGGFLLVVPSVILSLPLPPPGLSIGVTIPCKPVLGGVAVYLQVLELDPGASKGISFSRGMKMILGGP